jgi:cobalt-precorrin 5A hydrolase
MGLAMVTAAKVAVVALTAGGAMLANKIAHQLKTEVYVPTRLYKKTIQTSMSVHYFDDFDQCVEQIFGYHRQLIFIMATGIVVRKIAPLLNNKQVDPAVVVMDERANFAISLLSGHQGGANQLAHQVALITGATPVVTTATDVCHRGAVDVLAQKLRCNVYPLRRVKVFNRLLVENQMVNLYCQWPLPTGLNHRGLSLQVWSENIAPFLPAVIITNKLIPHSEDVIKLRPRNLVVGIGCRRGVTANEVIAAIKFVFARYRLSLLSLKQVASVDLKYDEKGLLEATANLKVPITFVTKSEITSLAGQYHESDIVKKKIGVGAVCEPSALIVSGQGKLIVAKQILGRVTVAVAEQALWW